METNSSLWVCGFQIQWFNHSYVVKSCKSTYSCVDVWTERLFQDAHEPSGILKPFWKPFQNADATLPTCHDMRHNNHFTIIILFLWLWEDKIVNDIEMQIMAEPQALCCFSWHAAHIGVEINTQWSQCWIECSLWFYLNPKTAREQTKHGCYPYLCLTLDNIIKVNSVLCISTFLKRDLKA